MYCVYVYMYMYIWLYSCIHVCVCKYKYVCSMYVCVYLYSIYIYIYIYMHTYIHWYALQIMETVVKVFRILTKKLLDVDSQSPEEYCMLTTPTLIGLCMGMTGSRRNRKKMLNKIFLNSKEEEELQETVKEENVLSVNTQQVIEIIKMVCCYSISCNISSFLCRLNVSLVLQLSFRKAMNISHIFQVQNRILFLIFVKLYIVDYYRYYRQY